MVLKIYSWPVSLVPFLPRSCSITLWYRVASSFRNTTGLILLHRGRSSTISLAFEVVCFLKHLTVIFRWKRLSFLIQLILKLIACELRVVIVNTITSESSVGCVQILANLLIGHATLQMVLELSFSDVTILSLRLFQILGHVSYFHEWLLSPIIGLSSCDFFLFVPYILHQVRLGILKYLS